MEKVEAAEKEQLQALESQLATKPGDYDAQVQYIQLLRKRGEVEKLREARENMDVVIPMHPSMWMEWAKDEASLSGESGFEAAEKLYERGIARFLSIPPWGVAESLSVPLWYDYLNYVQQNDPKVRQYSAEGISKARNLFERAVTSAALNDDEGSLIWEAYTQFEQAVLLTIDPFDIQAREEQVQRIRIIFHRHLSIPFPNLRSYLLAYKAWEVEQGNALDAESDTLDGLLSHVASAYRKAEEMYNAVLIMKNRSYLEFEKSFGDPSRVQMLYERSIFDFQESSYIWFIWFDYARYLDKTLKAGIIVKDVYSRATREFPWFGELWVRYLLCLERGNATEKEISYVFEKSLRCKFSNPQEYIEVLLTRVDGLRRRISSAGGDDALHYSLIRECFQAAAYYVSQHVPNTKVVLGFHAYWARFELKLGNGLVGARGVWESLLKTCGSMLEAWQGYIAMEIELGHINEARAIYKRCYSKRLSRQSSHDFCRAWLRFEGEFGTLEDLDYAMQKVDERHEELAILVPEFKSKRKAIDIDEEVASSGQDVMATEDAHK